MFRNLEAHLMVLQEKSVPEYWRWSFSFEYFFFLIKIQHGEFFVRKFRRFLFDMSPYVPAFKVLDITINLKF